MWSRAEDVHALPRPPETERETTKRGQRVNLGFEKDPRRQEMTHHMYGEEVFAHQSAVEVEGGKGMEERALERGLKSVGVTVLLDRV